MQKIKEEERSYDDRGGDAGKRGTGRRNEIIIGLAIVVTVLAIFFGVRYLEDRPMTGAYEITAEFTDAGGLLSGNRVTMRGIKIGEVRDVDLDPDVDRVRAILRIRKDVPIRRGATAGLQGLPALDDVSIAIRQGPEGAPPLEEGDVIQTRESVALMEQFDTTMAHAREALQQTQSLIAGADADMDVIMGRTQSLIGGADAQLGAVLANMRTASGEAASFVQSARGRLHETVVRLHAAVSRLDAVIDQFDHVAHTGGDSLVVAVNNLNAMMRRLDVALGAVERSSADMELMMASINAGTGTLGRFVHDPSLYVRLDSAAARLDEILKDFKENPKEYLRHLDIAFIDIF